MKVVLLIGWLMVDLGVALYYDLGYRNPVAAEEGTGDLRAMDDMFPPPPPPPDWP